MTGQEAIYRMHSTMRPTERTPLTRSADQPDYVEFASLLRTRRSRIRQFQCCICAIFIAVFTMALIVTVSYSVSHDTIDTDTNLTSELVGSRGNLSRLLKLGIAPGSGSYTLFNNIATMPGSRSIFVNPKDVNSSIPGLSNDEIREGLEAGQTAIGKRLTADAMALASPLPSPSPESRHRYAVSTCMSVGTLALAAVAELAATKKIENSRALLGGPSAIGSTFDSGWLPNSVCKDQQILKCPVAKYRTFDGTCNRIMQWGSTMTPYRRSLPPNYADGIQVPRRAMSGNELPSARQLSLKVHKPAPSSNPAFTVMLAVYGQFLDHDITATAISQGINGSSISCCPPAYGHPECFPVRVANGDPVFDVTHRTCMDFVRSAPAPQCKLGPRQQLNQVTAFIDGSTVYGSNVDTASSLREFAGGRLRMQLTPDNRTLLPASTNPNDGCNRDIERLRGRYCFAAGDARANENLHLTTMHLLWARQHNKVADELSKVNPTWDDETLYQESRRIVGAQLQHITYQEFVPIVLGERETTLRSLRPLKSGSRQWMENPNDPINNPSIANNFAAAAFRFAHTLLPGLMRVADTQKGTSSYVELHRMLFNPYSLYARGGVKSSVTSATSNVIQMTSTHVTSQLTSHLFEDPISNATVPCGLDLVSLNIQRGRDHGLPGYTSWREYCGLGKPESFADLEGYLDPQVLQEISMLYESVHDVDLYSGALAEIPTPGGIVGPTFTCLIADQFVRLQRGDRFWYEVPNQPHSFTESQLQQLRKTTLAGIICGCSDGVTQIQAEVMRSVGPNNPMMSCEDIPRLSFAPWKEDVSKVPPVLDTSFTPFDWTGFKNNINDTIREIVTYINSTKVSVMPGTTDWMTFKDYINDSFTDLRNQLNMLHPPKVIETQKPMEGITMNDDSFILRATVPPSIAQDWINFKMNLIKSLNDSVAKFSLNAEDQSKWIAFKQDTINQIDDLKNQVNSVTTELAPKLLLEKYKHEQIAMNPNNAMMGMESPDDLIVPVGAVFDWKHFKDNIVRSLDSAILDINDNISPLSDSATTAFGSEMNDRFATLRNKISPERFAIPTPLPASATDINSDWAIYKANIMREVNETLHEIYKNMPPHGDPAWTTFGPEIGRRFAALHDKINAERPATPREFATGEFDSNSGWLTYEANVIQTVNDAMQRIHNEKPSSGAAFKSDIMNNLPIAKGDLTSRNLIPDELAAQLYGIGKSAPLNELNNFTLEWIEFRNKINDSLMYVIQDIYDNKAAPVDSAGWAAFKASIANEFSKFRTDIANIKSEWIAKMTNMPLPVLSQPITASDYSKYYNSPGSFIPVSDWIDFKKQINDTLMNLLNQTRSTPDIDITDIHESFNQIFVELKNEIASLKDLILKNISNSGDDTSAPTDIWKADAAKWANFRMQLNSTMFDLSNSLKHQSQATIGEVMKVLFQARDKIASLEPPVSNPIGPESTDWIEFVTDVNKALGDSLRNVKNLKSLKLMANIAEPLVSSSGRLIIFTNLLLCSCMITLNTMFSQLLKFPSGMGC